jgi:hypothetical protein
VNPNCPRCFRQLLIAQVAYPAEYTDAGGWAATSTHSLFDAEEFIVFRMTSLSPLHEMLISMYSLLKRDYVSGIVAAMSAPPAKWQQHEACLYCLVAVMREIREDLTEGEDSIRSSIGTIMSLLAMLVRLPLADSPQPLVATVLNCLGKAAPILQFASGHLPPDFMSLLVNLLCGVLTNAAVGSGSGVGDGGVSEDDDEDDEGAVDTTTAASIAIHAIFKACWSYLLNPDVVRAIAEVSWP